MNAALLIDLYKAFHSYAINPEVESLLGNFTNRFNQHSNIPDNTHVVHFGLQRVIKKIYLEQWNKTFFSIPKVEAVGEYKRVVDAALNQDVCVKHMEALHDIGYLPIEVRALPEGSLVPYGVPVFVVESTVKQFGWVSLALETVTSSEYWGVATSATTAYAYRKRFENSLMPKDLIKFAGHDFSYRGMFGTEAAAMSGLGHLTSFVGSDTVPAALEAERFYGARIDKELVIAGVNATEHSVMCSYQQTGELESLKHLMNNVAPKGILSIVSDTWDFWKLVTEYLPELKDNILERDGQIVIRPDSGDPVKIICGRAEDVMRIETDGTYIGFDEQVIPEYEVKGLVECLWDTFGGTGVVSGYGSEPKVFRLLDSHIGAIYGDSITLARQDEIITKLEAKGFIPTVVLGIGSFTYQYVTRDTHGSAMKATSVGVKGEDIAIQKAPKTDSSKKSGKGLPKVIWVKDKGLQVVWGVTRASYLSGENLLKPIFRDGKLLVEYTLEDVRSMIDMTFE